MTLKNPGHRNQIDRAGAPQVEKKTREKVEKRALLYVLRKKGSKGLFLLLFPPQRCMSILSITHTHTRQKPKSTLSRENKAR